MRVEPPETRPDAGTGRRRGRAPAGRPAMTLEPGILVGLQHGEEQRIDLVGFDRQPWRPSAVANGRRSPLAVSTTIDRCPVVDRAGRSLREAQEKDRRAERAERQGACRDHQPSSPATGDRLRAPLLPVSDRRLPSRFLRAAPARPRRCRTPFVRTVPVRTCPRREPAGARTGPARPPGRHRAVKIAGWLGVRSNAATNRSSRYSSCAGTTSALSQSRAATDPLSTSWIVDLESGRRTVDQEQPRRARLRFGHLEHRHEPLVLAHWPVSTRVPSSLSSSLVPHSLEPPRARNR